MPIFTKLGAEILRDNQASVPWKVIKADMRQWMLEVETYITNLNSYAAPRTKVTSLQLYVNINTGSDSNDGRTTSTAFLTIQKAVDVLYQNFDCGGSPPTINIMYPGNYDGFEAQGSPTGYHFFYLKGYTSGVIRIKPPSGKNACCLIGDNAIVIFQNVGWYSTASGQYAIFMHQKGIIDIFPGCIFESFPSGVHIGNDGGNAEINLSSVSGYRIVGGASEHISISGAGHIKQQGAVTVSIENGPTFYNFYNLAAAGGNLLIGGTTSYTGSMTVTNRFIQCIPGTAVYKNGNTVPTGASADGGGGYIVA